MLAVLPNVKDNPNRASLLRVLGRIGDSSALPTLRTALSSREAEIQDAAIRALSDWPTSEPVPDLLKVAQTAENARYKILALRGFVRLLGLESSRSAEETIDLYKKAMDLAGDAQEKKRVLSGLAAAKSPAALNMAAAYLDDLALHLEAESAAVQIAQGTYGSRSAAHERSARQGDPGHQAGRASPAGPGDHRPDRAIRRLHRRVAGQRSLHEGRAGRASCSTRRSPRSRKGRRPSGVLCPSGPTPTSRG